jgi:hypothetical protein
VPASILIEFYSVSEIGEILHPEKKRSEESPGSKKHSFINACSQKFALRMTDLITRLSKKGVIPYWIRSFFEREAISPSVDMGRRYRIVVRYDGIDNISTIPRPFWTASDERDAKKRKCRRYGWCPWWQVP